MEVGEGRGRKEDERGCESQRARFAEAAPRGLPLSATATTTLDQHKTTYLSQRKCTLIEVLRQKQLLQLLHGILYICLYIKAASVCAEFNFDVRVEFYKFTLDIVRFWLAR